MVIGEDTPPHQISRRRCGSGFGAAEKNVLHGAYSIFGGNNVYMKVASIIIGVWRIYHKVGYKNEFCEKIQGLGLGQKGLNQL